MLMVEVGSQGAILIPHSIAYKLLIILQLRRSTEPLTHREYATISLGLTLNSWAIQLISPFMKLYPKLERL